MLDILALLSGALVGFSLGLIGGGGSILATPLLLYVVGIQSPHVAIGTGALAVAANAFAGFAGHARSGTVRWRSAILFAVIGMIGAALGSSAGKAFNGERLLFLFALLMIAVGIMMLRPRHVGVAGTWEEQFSASAAGKIALSALFVGALSGFFGIGGGFLIVPGLVFATGMPMINAIGSSLLSVGSFGLTTGISYALAGLVNWLIVVEYLAGGILGGVIGARLALSLGKRKKLLVRIFAAVVLLVAVYMLSMNLFALHLLR